MTLYFRGVTCYTVKKLRDIKQDNKARLEAINTRNYRYKLADNLNFIQDNDVIFAITKNDKPMAVTLSSELFMKLLVDRDDKERLDLLLQLDALSQGKKQEVPTNYYEKLDKFAKQLKKGALSQSNTTYSELISLTSLANKLKGNKPDIDLETYTSILSLIKRVVVKAMENLDLYKDVSDYVVPNSIVTVEIEGERESFFITNMFSMADPLARMISSESPLGHALIGKAKGDEVHVNAPIGTLVYKIVKII